MTREEIIEQLESLHRLLKRLAEMPITLGRVKPPVHPDDMVALELAISALREQEERNKGCELCHSENLRNVGITDRVYLCGGNSRPRENEKFRFCPKCGRRLEEV